MCINGMSVYTAKRNPLKAFRNKTDEYVDDQVMLGGRFSAKGFQDSVGGGGGGGGVLASAPTEQLPCLRLVLSAILYRKWNFRVTDVAKEFLKSKPFSAGYFRFPTFVCGKRAVGKIGITETNLLTPQLRVKNGISR